MPEYVPLPHCSPCHLQPALQLFSYPKKLTARQSCVQDTPKSTVMLSARSSVDPFGPGDGGASEEDEHLASLLANPSDYLHDRQAHPVVLLLCMQSPQNQAHAPATHCRFRCVCILKEEDRCRYLTHIISVFHFMLAPRLPRGRLYIGLWTFSCPECFKG